MPESSRKPTTLLVFLGLAVVWGSSFLFIEVGLQGLSAPQVVFGRVGFGALTLVAVMLLSRRRWPRERWIWGHMLVVGLFFCVFPFLLFAWAGETLPSGLSSILNATTPIMTLAIAAIMLPAERLNALQIAGLVLGIAGVLVIVGPWELFTSPVFYQSVPAQIACLGATACYGFALSYLRRFISGKHSYDAPTIAAVQLVLAFGVILLITPFTMFTPMQLSWPVVLSVAALGILGTGVAYIGNTVVVSNWGANAAAGVTYLVPVVGVLLGVLVLQETLHWNEPVGGLIVILAILISQGRLRFPVRKPAPELPVRETI